jgi:hypothetical protein
VKDRHDPSARPLNGALLVGIDRDRARRQVERGRECHAHVYVMGRDRGPGVQYVAVYKVAIPLFEEGPLDNVPNSEGRGRGALGVRPPDAYSLVVPDAPDRIDGRVRARNPHVPDGLYVFGVEDTIGVRERALLEVVGERLLNLVAAVGAHLDGDVEIRQLVLLLLRRRRTHDEP